MEWLALSTATRPFLSVQKMV